MGSSIGYKLLTSLTATVAVIILLPLLAVVLGVTYLASIPSRVGARVPIEDWLFKTITKVLDADLMLQFRDDTFRILRRHLVFEEDHERWWVIREIDLARERTNKRLQSGEYVLVVLLAAGGVFIESSLIGIPISIVLTGLAVILSGMILVRVVLFKLLAFRSELHLQDSTHDLAVRMMFNKAPFARGSSIALGFVALLVGTTGGVGYDWGMELIERYVSRTHPEDVKRWESQE